MSEFEDQRADWFDEDLPPSKSQIKRDLDALKDLGRELIALPPKELEKLELDEQLDDAINNARSMSKGALKRQTGYIGRLIAERDHEQLQQQLDALRQPHQDATQQFHQLEKWRDRLLADDEFVMSELRNRFESLDSQHVRQLVRNAQREAANSQPPKSARLLYKYLQQLE